MVNTEELGCIVPTWEFNPPAADAEVLAAARARVGQKMAGQIAPQRAIDVIEAGLSLPFHDALPVERAAFIELKGSDQARALRHIFFAERGAKQPNTITADPAPLDHIAVVGGGTMGAGIAYALLNAGLTVTLLETDAEGVTRAQENVEKIIAASLKRGLISESGAEDRRKRLTATTDYAKAASATFNKAG